MYHSKKMTARSLISDRAGFSLIEVMIVAGIIGVLSLGIVAIFQYQNKMSATGNNNAQINEIKSQIQSWISSNATCNYTFQGMRAGEYLIGFMGNNTGGPQDILYSVGVPSNGTMGARFPGTNWAISSAQLLLGGTVAATPQTAGISPVVSSDGTGTGVLKVTLQLLTGTSGNATPVPGSQNNFGSTTKTLYFSVPAVFGDAVLVQTTSCSSLDPSVSSPQGRCCWNCYSNVGTGATYAGDYGAQVGTVSASNPVYFSSSYNANLPAPYGCTADYSGAAGVSTFLGNCYIYNYNLPILSCNTPK